MNAAGALWIDRYMDEVHISASNFTDCGSNANAAAVIIQPLCVCACVRAVGVYFVV
jgi:hypothetical protein